MNPAWVLRRVLVVLDNPELTASAIAHGLALARAHDAQVLFVDIPQAPQLTADPAAIDTLAMAARTSAQAHGVAASFISVATLQDIATAAVNQACDIVVMARPDAHAMQRLFSADPVQTLLNSCTVPVLVCAAAAALDSAAAPLA